MAAQARSKARSYTPIKTNGSRSTRFRHFSTLVCFGWRGAGAGGAAARTSSSPRAADVADPDMAVQQVINEHQQVQLPQDDYVPKTEAGHWKTLSVLQAVEFEDLRSPYRVFARVLD
jgi:hypothetical protein